MGDPMGLLNLYHVSQVAFKNHCGSILSTLSMLLFVFETTLKKPEAYIYWGFTAMLAGLIILVQGLLVLRRRWYEMFLILHIILAIVFIGGAWKHVDALYCVWFYYTSAAVWAFDRIIRICRLVSFGFPKAQVYLLPDETLKVVVPKPDNWEAVPGGHAFIHF